MCVWAARLAFLLDYKYTGRWSVTFSALLCSFFLSVHDSQTGADKYVSKVWRQSLRYPKPRQTSLSSIRTDEKALWIWLLNVTKQEKWLETRRRDGIRIIFFVSEVLPPCLKAREGSEAAATGRPHQAGDSRQRQKFLEGKSCRVLIGCASCWQVVLAAFCLNCSRFWAASSFIHFSFTIYGDGF